VEPQTAPPDAANLAAAAGEEPDVADRGRPMAASMAWRWRNLDENDRSTTRHGVRHPLG
jgi:hypothetical protein